MLEKVIDHCIVEEILTTKPISRRMKHIQDRVISLSGAVVPNEEIKSRYLKIKKGRSIACLPSIFNGVVGPREGKEQAYSSFWDMVSEHIARPMTYIGLPANQIHSLLSRVSTVVAFERDAKMSAWQQKYIKQFLPNQNVLLYDCDIFDEGVRLPANTRPNIFDLDLMCFANKDLFKQVGSLIARHSLPRQSVAVNLATCVGRKITIEQYNDLVHTSLVSILEEYSGKWVVKHEGNRYRDRVIPIQYEHLILA